MDARLVEVIAGSSPGDALLALALEDCFGRAGLTVSGNNSQAEPSVRVFVGDPGRARPADGTKTIWIVPSSAEDPSYDRILPALALSDRVFCLQPSMRMRLESHGVRATYLRIGQHPIWTTDETITRDIDLSFCGLLTPRSGYVLACLADVLHPTSSRLHFYEKEVKAGELARPLEPKEFVDLLSRSSMCLEPGPHLGASLSPVVLSAAASCGAVLVTDGRVEDGPFQPSAHLITMSAETLPLIVRLLLRSPERVARMREEAYEAARSRTLFDSIGDLIDEAMSPGRDPSFSILGSLPAGPVLEGPTAVSALTDDPSKPLRAQSRSLKNISSRLSALEREVMALSGRSDLETVVSGSTSTPQVSVLITLHNYESFIAAAIVSAFLSEDVDVEVVVVDDASTDASNEMVTRFMEAHPDAPLTLVTKRINQGLAAARNTALQHARAEFVFILDADNLVFPSAIAKLCRALRSEPGAAFSYGMLKVFSSSGPVGVMSELGWDPLRVTRGNYIDAMALLRKDRLLELGGYDARFDGNGHSDYAVWLKLIESGGYGIFVPGFVGAYRRHEGSMLSSMPLEGARPMVEEVFKEHLGNLRKERLQVETVE